MAPTLATPGATGLSASDFPNASRSLRRTLVSGSPPRHAQRFSEHLVLHRGEVDACTSRPCQGTGFWSEDRVEQRDDACCHVWRISENGRNLNRRNVYGLFSSYSSVAAGPLLERGMDRDARDRWPALRFSDIVDASRCRQRPQRTRRDRSRWPSVECYVPTIATMGAHMRRTATLSLASVAPPSSMLSAIRTFLDSLTPMPSAASSLTCLVLAVTTLLGAAISAQEAGAITGTSLRPHAYSLTCTSLTIDGAGTIRAWHCSTRKAPGLVQQGNERTQDRRFCWRISPCVPRPCHRSSV